MNKIIKFTSLILVLTFLITTGQSCSRGGTQDAKQQASERVTIKFWSVYDESAAFSEIIQDYRAQHPNVSIEYRKLRYEEYEDELLEAFARGEGPDIFSIHNTWMKKYQELMSPMPGTVQVAFIEETGTVKKEQVARIVTQKLYTPNQVRSLYGDTVADDVVLKYNQGTEDDPQYFDRVYGLPLSLDTLALFYNKDLLNNSGIALPAQYWTDVQNQIESIRKTDEDGNIVTATIPLGTADNIVRSFDILSLLMLQLQTIMVDDSGQVQFNRLPAEFANQGITVAPGINALDFYTSFADPLLTSYTWNNELDNSLNSFISGKTAYFLGYSYHRPIIEAQAPKLNFAIGPMLQIQGANKVNYANYWVNGVAAQAKNKDWAWDFIRFMSTEEEAIKYLNNTNKPAALRSLYDDQLQNEEVAVFTEQTLTAQSWYRGLDVEAAEDIFADMINSVNNAEATSKQAIDLAAQKIQQTLR